MHTWRFNLSPCRLDEDDFSAKFPTMMLFKLSAHVILTFPLSWASPHSQLLTYESGNVICICTDRTKNNGKSQTAWCQSWKWYSTHGDLLLQLFPAWEKWHSPMTSKGSERKMSGIRGMKFQPQQGGTRKTKIFTLKLKVYRGIPTCPCTSWEYIRKHIHIKIQSITWHLIWLFEVKFVFPFNLSNITGSLIFWEFVWISSCWAGLENHFVWDEI